MNWEKLKFLGLETTRIWDFVQLSINWWNWLVLLIHFVIIYCYLTCVMINLSIFWDFWKWVFKIWGFCYNLYVQANSVFLKSNWVVLNASMHASYVNNVHASYKLFFLSSNYIWCSLPLGFHCFFFLLSLFCLSFPILSIMVRKTKAHRTSTSSFIPSFDSERFLSEKNQETYEKLNILRSMWAERKVVLYELHP